MSDTKLSDKALSVLTFAAYHSLLSGDAVREVVTDDGKGHRADPEGLSELEAAGLIEPGEGRGRFTEPGTAILGRIIDAIRGVAAR